MPAARNEPTAQRAVAGSPEYLQIVNDCQSAVRLLLDAARHGGIATIVLDSDAASAEPR
jgi:hypothetical protein